MIDLQRVRPLLRYPVDLVRAVALLTIIHRRLQQSGYRTTSSWLDGRIPPAPDVGAVPSAAAIRRAEDLGAVVRAASRFVPDATCLRKSLALQQLLKRYETPAIVRLGVMPNSESNVGLAAAFRFHAWVEVGDRVVSEPPQSVAGFVPFEATDDVTW